MLTQLFESANKGAAVQDLQTQAIALVKAEDGSRLRADERYQLQLAGLRKAAAAAPQNAAPLADLGEFLYNGATMILSESVEPRSAPKPYRPLTKEGQKRELAEAEQVLDKALGLDANNLKAMAFKPACLMERSQWGDAETLLRRAIQVGPHDANALEFFARVMDHAGGVAAAAAANLRSVKTWSDALYTYTRSPTQAELREADQLDAKAKQCWAEAKNALQLAAEAARGTARGALFQAMLAQRDNDVPAVRTALESAVKLDPGFVRAWQELIQVYDRLNLTNEAYQARFTAANLVQTTAGADAEALLARRRADRLEEPARRWTGPPRPTRPIPAWPPIAG